jgi:mannose-6-phosphate isomerase
MCIDGAFEIEYNKDLYQYKRRYGSNPAAMDYYVINGKLLF